MENNISIFKEFTKRNKNSYLISLIIYLSPKVIITLEDNSFRFQK